MNSCNVQDIYTNKYYILFILKKLIKTRFNQEMEQEGLALLAIFKILKFSNPIIKKYTKNHIHS